MTKKLSTVWLLFLLSFTLVYGQDENSEEMEDLSLASLFDLNMEVTVASKKAEKLSDAPGIIVAYSAKDLQNLGIFNIRDLASLTTGYSPYYSIGEQTLETRGQKAAGFDNNKHLLLVNGLPMRHARAGRVPMVEEMPLFMAERVEFLKGAGSALYGTGAFFGVINIVPKTLNKNGVISDVSITGGSNQLSKSLVGNLIAKNDFGHFSSFVSYFDRETEAERTQFRGGRKYIRYDTTMVNPDSMVVTETVLADSMVADSTVGYRNWDDRTAIFMNMDYRFDDSFLKGTSIGFIYSRKSGGLGEFWWMNSAAFNDLTWETVIPYVKYAREFTEMLSVNAYVLGNQSVERAFLAPEYAGYKGEEYMVKVADMEMLGEVGIDLKKAGSIIAGVNYDYRKSVGQGASFGSFQVKLDGGENLTFPKAFASEPFHTVSYYGQYQNTFPLLAGFKLTGGFRHDIGITKGNTFQKFSPRLGIVQKFTENLNLKVLLGTALRAPGIKEAGLNQEVRDEMTKFGNTNQSDVPDLKAEKIMSLETGVNASFSKITGSVAGFFNRTEDSMEKKNIKGNNTGDPHTVFYNALGKTDAWGVEADIVAAPVKGLKLMAGYSFAEATLRRVDAVTEKETDTLQMDGVPVSKINSAISYTTPTKMPFTISPSFHYYTKYRKGGRMEETDDDKKFISENDGNFYTLDLNLRFEPTKNLALNLQFLNLTDNRYYQPGIWLFSANRPGVLNGQNVTIQEGGLVDIKRPAFTFKAGVTASF